MTEMGGKTPDIAQENIEQLKQLFPDVFAEGKIDFAKLKQVLGDYVDDATERYNFTWNGKGRALRLAQSPSTGTLRPCPEESKDWDTTQNLYIEGDNLEVLKLLQKSYHGKVKMIYIDPPYNTGGDFVYPDDYADNLENYKRITGQVDEDGRRIGTNTESDGRYHSNWLNMMYPRLRLARSLLREDGVIFISIDDNEVDNLRKICNEIFGESNFLAHIVWQKKYSVSNDDPGIAPMHDHIIVYQRSEEFHRLLLPRTEKQNERYKNPDNDPRGPWTSGEYVSSKSRIERPTLWYPIKHPKTGEDIYPDENAVWRYSQEKHLQMEAENRLFWGEDYSYKIPRMKRFLAEIKDGVVPSTWWTFTEAGHNDEASKETSELIGKKVFSTPKPVRLLRRILDISVPNDDSIVLDFFAGSAATAHAVMKQNVENGGNRRFMMVQLPEPVDEKSEAFQAGYKNICEIGKERIRRAGDKIKEEAGLTAQNLDIGFKVFKLDSSNLKKWNTTAVQLDEDGNQVFSPEQMELDLLDAVGNYVPGRSELDVVYEIALKLGLDLTYPVEQHAIAGKNVYTIGFGALMICLDDAITKEVAIGMIALKEELRPETWKVVFKDNGFASDADKANICETLKLAGLNEEDFTTV